MTETFNPNKDLDIAETCGLPIPLENHDFDSYNLIVVVSKKDDTFLVSGADLVCLKA